MGKDKIFSTLYIIVPPLDEKPWDLGSPEFACYSNLISKKGGFAILVTLLYYLNYTLVKVQPWYVVGALLWYTTTMETQHLVLACKAVPRSGF